MEKVGAAALPRAPEQCERRHAAMFMRRQPHMKHAAAKPPAGGHGYRQMLQVSSRCRPGDGTLCQQKAVLMRQRAATPAARTPICLLQIRARWRYVRCLFRARCLPRAVAKS